MVSASGPDRKARGSPGSADFWSRVFGRWLDGLTTHRLVTPRPGRWHPGLRRELSGGRSSKNHDGTEMPERALVGVSFKTQVAPVTRRPRQNDHGLAIEPAFLAGPSKIAPSLFGTLGLPLQDKVDARGRTSGVHEARLRWM